LRCILCQNLSVYIICKACQNCFLKPNFKTRILEDDFKVHSFYEYKEIKELINTKYEFYGDRVFKILANLSFKKFANEFTYNSQVYAISVDDVNSHQFSQGSILVKALKSNNIKPIYNTLKAQNKVKYAGKSLEFRRKNKRNYKYFGKKNIQIILVDDIITSGNTLLEAKQILQNNKCELLFALTLSDAKI